MGFERRKILIVVSQLDLGGTEQHLYRVLPHLRSAGVDIHVYSMRANGYFAGPIREAGITVHEPAYERVPLFAPIYNCIEILRILYTWKPDIIHFFLPKAYLLGGLTSLLRHSLFRVMSRRSLNLYQRNRPGAAVAERWLHNRMDAITGNSKAVIEQLAETEGVPRDKLTLIYNGLDAAEMTTPMSQADVREKLGIPGQVTVLIMVANLIPYKGHHVLLNALDIVNRKYGHNWVLLCAGRDDGAGAQLEKLSRTLAIEERVRFLGSRTDIAELLKAADIAVLSSLQEGFSNFILEAMAAGLPVIATDVGGNGEAVTDEETGRLVPPNEPDRLAEAIHILISNPLLAKQMGAQGKLHITNKFSLDKCIDQYMDIYNNLAHLHDSAKN